MARALGPAALAVIALGLVGCGEAEPEPASSEVAEASEPAEPEPEAPIEPDPSSPCGRALSCCRAYAEAVPNVVEESACAGPAEVAGEPDADARCARMAHGWREALELMRDTGAPAACRP